MKRRIDDDDDDLDDTRANFKRSRSVDGRDVSNVDDNGSDDKARAFAALVDSYGRFVRNAIYGTNGDTSASRAIAPIRLESIGYLVSSSYRNDDDDDDERRAVVTASIVAIRAPSTSSTNRRETPLETRMTIA